MRATSIVGPITGRPYPAYDTGRRWNGASVIAFTSDVLAALIAAGDGTDANGEGLAVAEGGALDVSDGRAEPVETICAPTAGAVTTLYVPAGRMWCETDPNSTVTGIGYDEADACRACGEHISAPRSPGCPA